MMTYYDSSCSRSVFQKDHKLIDSGLYSVVRHPSYTGLMLVFVGWYPWQFGKGLIESGLWNMAFGRTLIMAYSFLPCAEKDVEGRRSAYKLVRHQVRRLGEESSISHFSWYLLGV